MTVAVSPLLPTASPPPRGHGGWTLFALIAAAALSVPVLTVFASWGAPRGDVWSHLASTVLPRYATNSAWLMGGVAVGVAAVGVAAGWLVTMTRFPGARVFEWALLLPMAMPAYVIAYTYAGLLDFAGPVQSFLRATFGWTRRDYWFPDIRSLGGAIAMFVLVLYPYVYLLARAAFIAQSVCVLEVSRTLGAGPWRSFARVALPLARPAVVGGVALALMETLSDFGTVQHFAVDTFTTGIYRTWHGLGEPAAAAQLAALLLLIVLGLFALERYTRGERRYHDTSRVTRALPTRRLTGWRAAAAVACCAAPVALGFVVPAGALVGWVVERPEMLVSAPYLRLALNSFALAAGAAAAAVAVALAIAYGLRLDRGPAMTAAARIAGLGYAVPGAVVAVGVMLPFAWAERQLDDAMRDWFGVSTGLLFSGTLAALVFGYLVRFLAVALNPVEAGLGRVTPSMDGAARTLGAAPARVLRDVHVPLVAGGIVTGALLVFVDVMKELPATLLMRPFNFETLAVRTYQLAADERLAEAAAPALALVAVGIVPVILLSRALARSRPGHA